MLRMSATLLDEYGMVWQANFLLCSTAHGLQSCRISALNTALAKSAHEALVGHITLVSGHGVRVLIGGMAQ